MPISLTRQRLAALTGGLIATALLAAGQLLTAPGAAASASGGVTCAGYSVSVSLAAGQPADLSVWGQLCATPRERVWGTTVQLLIHGATYTHTYWDFGVVNGQDYSYARDVAAAGIPTFAIDQLGAGNSSHPLSTDVTIQVAAYAAHQVVQALRNGTATGIRFGKVVEVGHSFGSVASTLEAGTYHDVNGVILTADTHADTAFHNNAQPDIYPAGDDPLFAGSGLDSGYLTTVPGTRGYLFYAPGDAEPAVIAQDEATKSTIPLTMFLGGLQVLQSDDTAAISVPALLIDGSHDQLSCGALAGGGTYDCSSGSAIAAQEAPYYSPAAQLRACIVPGSGHDINLSLNHQTAEAQAILWTYEYVGQLGTGQINSRALPSYCSP